MTWEEYERGAQIFAEAIRAERRRKRRARILILAGVCMVLAGTVVRLVW